MGFVEMGIVLNHVELQPAQKMILMALADRADAEGVCWPSIGEIAHRTCQSERTVLRHIAALKDLGLLTSQQRRYRTAKGDTRQASNVYHLNLAGMLAGNFDSRPKREKTSSGPGCQSVIQENVPAENLQVNPGCQSVQSQGDNSVSRRTCHKELTIPVPVPAEANQDQATGPGGAAAPADSGSPSDSGTASPAAPRSARSAASDDDWDKVFTCLPSRMAEYLPAAKIPQIAGYLSERIDAGWQPGRIRAILDGRALPEQVENMTGLVIARLRDDVPVEAAPPNTDELRRRRLAKRDAELSQFNNQSQSVKAPAELTEQEREERARRRRELLAQVGISLGGSNRRKGV